MFTIIYSKNICRTVTVLRGSKVIFAVYCLADTQWVALINNNYFFELFEEGNG